VTLRTIEVALTEVTDDVKAVPSTLFVIATVAPVTKPVPVMVTVVGAVASQTLFGLIKLMVGIASRLAASVTEVATPFPSVRTTLHVAAAVPVVTKLAVPVVAEVSATELKTNVPAEHIATNVLLVAPLFAKPEPVNVAVPDATSAPVAFGVAP